MPWCAVICCASNRCVSASRPTKQAAQLVMCKILLRVCILILVTCSFSSLFRAPSKFSLQRESRAFPGLGYSSCPVVYIELPRVYRTWSRIPWPLSLTLLIVLQSQEPSLRVHFYARATWCSPTKFWRAARYLQWSGPILQVRLIGL
jgi:hypothetical protein